MQQVRPVIAGLAITLVLGCSATPPRPTASPTALATVSPTATVPSAPPSPTGQTAAPATSSAAPATLSPAPRTPVPSPPPAEELFAVEWQTARLLPDGWEEGAAVVDAGSLGFVAVGNVDVVDNRFLEDGFAAAYQSADGLVWNATRLPGGRGQVAGVTVDGLAVVVGCTMCFQPGPYQGDPGSAGQVWTSSDGLDWKGHRLGEGEWPQIVTAGGPGYVALGQLGNVEAGIPRLASWTSADGRNWSPPAVIDHGCEACHDFFINDVLATEAGLVAIGYGLIEGANGDDEQLMAWTSADGATWQLSEIPQAARSGRWRALAAGGPGLVAVGTDCADVDCLYIQGVVWTSLDGTTWSRVPLFVGVELYDVAPVADFLVAVGESRDGPAILASHDGLEWLRFTNVPGLDGLESIAVLGDRIVAATWFGDAVVGTYQP